jgi:hypothetical protein
MLVSLIVLRKFVIDFSVNSTYSQFWSGRVYVCTASYDAPPPQFLLCRRVLESNPGPVVIKKIMSPCPFSKNRGFGTILDEQNIGWGRQYLSVTRINAAR